MVEVLLRATIPLLLLLVTSVVVFMSIIFVIISPPFDKNNKAMLPLGVFVLIIFGLALVFVPIVYFKQRIYDFSVIKESNCVYVVDNVSGVKSVEYHDISTYNSLCKGSEVYLEKQYSLFNIEVLQQITIKK